MDYGACARQRALQVQLYRESRRRLSPRTRVISTCRLHVHVLITGHREVTGTKTVDGPPPEVRIPHDATTLLATDFWPAPPSLMPPAMLPVSVFPVMVYLPY